MKGPCLNDGQWHHVALSASSDWQCMIVDGRIVCSINFGIGHELHRCVNLMHKPVLSLHIVYLYTWWLTANLMSNITNPRKMYVTCEPSKMPFSQ